MMEYRNLGKSGLRVSRIALGCMSYGMKPREWRLGEDESRGFIRKALDLGINFFDTANMYGSGESEELLGRSLSDYAERDAVVIATKVYYRMHDDVNGAGLSRKAIMREVDASLRRLRTDYIDLYQIHRWDDQITVEETMEALHDVVKSGKARYIGASSMPAWRFAKALYTADMHGWTRFISMQPHYNMLYREEEREMLPFCSEEGVGVIPWSPLARGRLTRGWKDRVATKRAGLDGYGKSLYDHTEDVDEQTIERLTFVSEERGIPQAQLALAWLLQKPAVTSPIIGATKPHHLDDAVAALSVHLSEEERLTLEACYEPHAVAGII